jgi:lysophospholipase L1-like esterase
LALIGFSRLVVSLVRGRVDEVWVGDSNAVFFAADRFPTLGIGSTEPGRWVLHLGPRLIFSLARDGYPQMMYRMLRLLRRVPANRNVLWIFSAGEIDLRCHLVPRLKQGADLGFVAAYIERVRDLVEEFDGSVAVVGVPVPAAVNILESDGFPVVGSPEERRAAHGRLREQILAATGPAVNTAGVRIHALDMTDRFSTSDGTFRTDVTGDGIHPNEAGRAEIREAVAELRRTVFAGARA